MLITLLLAVAIVLYCLGAAGTPQRRVNYVPAGHALCALAFLLLTLGH